MTYTSYTPHMLPPRPSHYYADDAFEAVIQRYYFDDVRKAEWAALMEKDRFGRYVMLQKFPQLRMYPYYRHLYRLEN